MLAVEADAEEAEFARARRARAPGSSREPARHAPARPRRPWRARRIRPARGAPSGAPRRRRRRRRSAGPRRHCAGRSPGRARRASFASASVREVALGEGIGDDRDPLVHGAGADEAVDRRAPRPAAGRSATPASARRCERRSASRAACACGGAGSGARRARCASRRCTVSAAALARPVRLVHRARVLHASASPCGAATHGPPAPRGGRQLLTGPAGAQHIPPRDGTVRPWVSVLRSDPGDRTGRVSRAAKGADCKSAGVRLRRFESYLSHHASPLRASRGTAKRMPLGEALADLISQLQLDGPR